MTIQQKCNELNRSIHDRLFLNNYLSTTIGDYERVFTSIDLIEDCENAIEEFENIAEANLQNRSTLYIYGVLQSMYCQQDGLFHLYRTITKKTLKNVYGLFELYNFNKSIREVRDDIAGHPADRKNGKEFYFIGKGPNTKYSFSYAGYTPHFRKVDVDLRLFIEEQRKFTTTVLNDVGKAISEQIQTHKDKFKSMKLTDIVDNFNYPTQLIYRGIFNNHPLAEIGLKEIREKLDTLKSELGKRYNNKIPDSISDIFRLQNHILLRIDCWIANKELERNTDAEIFMDSFDHQMDELLEILNEIDDEFGK
ncbi:MAG: hypothetical protein GX163_00980 [Bacteroidetes bacterium]|jgi:hypothetical protein|nr:hypothetical protein [Bacteroidota bacterium]